MVEILNKHWKRVKVKRQARRDDDDDDDDDCRPW
jgi:hypothetical protein